jgi:hypothetical protein
VTPLRALILAASTAAGYAFGVGAHDLLTGRAPWALLAGVLFLGATAVLCLAARMP